MEKVKSQLRRHLLNMRKIGVYTLAFGLICLNLVTSAKFDSELQTIDLGK